VPRVCLERIGSNIAVLIVGPPVPAKSLSSMVRCFGFDLPEVVLAWSERARYGEKQQLVFSTAARALDP
jgi:hypothetical protein